MQKNILPNVLSLLRLLVSPLVFYTLTKGYYCLCSIILIFAAGSDFLDGFLARRFDVCSRLGSMLDPLADKILAVLFFYGAYTLNQIPFWLFNIIIVRDILITFGVSHLLLIQAISKTQKPFYAIFTSKLNTFIQFILALIILVNLSMQGFDLVAILQEAFIYILAFTTLISSFLYIKLYLALRRGDIND